VDENLLRPNPTSDENKKWKTNTEPPAEENAPEDASR
jgi:hypothetical protein